MLKRLDCPPWDRVRLKHLDACALTPRRAGGAFRWAATRKGASAWSRSATEFDSPVSVCSARDSNFVCGGLQDGPIFMMCRSRLQVIDSLIGHTRAVRSLVYAGNLNA